MNWKPFDSLTTHSAFRRYCRQGRSSWFRRILTARICNSRKRDIDNGRLIHTSMRETMGARSRSWSQHPEPQSIQCGSPKQDVIVNFDIINQLVAYLCTNCFISAGETYSSRLSLCYILPVFVQCFFAAHFNWWKIRVGQKPKAKRCSGTTTTWNIDNIEKMHCH